MANNTRYQPVQSRDSVEEQGYSQAPPSYQAEPILGESRSEDDNVPDDFKVHTPTIVPDNPPRNSILTSNTVRRQRRRSHPPHPHAIHPQSLLNPHRPTPLHHHPQQHLLLFACLQILDPVPPVDDVAFPLRSNRLHAPHILETQKLSHELAILDGIHCVGGLRDQCDCEPF